MVARPSLKRVVPGSVPPWRALWASRVSTSVLLLEPKFGQAFARAKHARFLVRASWPRPRRSFGEGARAVCFLAFDGHCYMYRAVKRALERQAPRVLYRGEARQTLPPIQEWRRFDAADVQPGLFWCEDLRAAPAHGRRREPQGGHQQPGAVLRAEAEAGHQDPRAAGGARGGAEVVREAKREVPGAVERQKTLAAQDGKRALCCGLTAGACELDHVAPVRQAPSVRL